MEHYACALLLDLYRLQEHVFNGRAVDMPLDNPALLFNTLLPKIQSMDVNSCYNFSENLHFLMLSFHCPNAKTLRALLQKEDVEENEVVTKEPFTVEAAKTLKQQYPQGSMPQLVNLAVERYNCAPQYENVLWYLPDQHFSVFSPYMHVIRTNQEPSFKVARTENKYCCFTSVNKQVVTNGFRKHAKFCAALNVLFPPTVPLSIKYQEYQDTENKCEELIKSNIHTL